MNKALAFLLILMTGCSFQNPNLKSDEYSVPNNISSDTKLSMNSLAFNPYSVKGNDKNNEVIKSWFNYALVKDKKIVINQVVLTDTNERIDDTGTQSIKPDYSGKDINITIKGDFDNNIVLPKNITYTNDTNLLQVSYVGELFPVTKVMIDDSILLEPVSATRTEIKLKLKTEAIPEYYLKGLHKLSIVTNNGVDAEKNGNRTDTLIRIGDPEIPKTSLSPSIDEVKIIKVKDISYDKDSKGYVFNVLDQDKTPEELKKLDKETPINIKIKGRNFMMFYKFSYSTIDSKFGFGHSTAISKDAQGNTVWESIIHIPDSKEFTTKTEHFLTYSTPFGTSIKRF